MENLLPLLIIGGSGMILTLILLLTGKKENPPNEIQKTYDIIPFLSISLAIIPIIFLLRLALMFFTGIFSGFIPQGIIGGLIALIPLIIIYFLKIQTQPVSKEQ